jgi:acetyl-CoA C-acetyltransferase
MDVDMAAAIIVTDAATARSWGLGADEVAYMTGWADAHDVWYLSERPVLHRSPALAECARRALDSAGVTMDELEGLDLYSCFPSSVEVARDSFGIAPGDSRPLTLTGGLPYHGGPGSNYVTHSIANTLAWLRAGQGEHALVHGNGYYLTKHSVGLYTRRVPDEPPLPPEKLQEAVDEMTSALVVEPSVASGATGAVVAYTAPFERDGDPGPAIVLVDLDVSGGGGGGPAEGGGGGGRRTVARADDALTTALLEGDGVGARVVFRNSDEGNVVGGT